MTWILHTTDTMKVPRTERAKPQVRCMQDMARAAAQPHAGPGLGVVHVSATLERDKGQLRFKRNKGWGHGWGRVASFMKL